MRKMFRTRKAKKGLSGAVTALILVIASVIIALVVVAFAFGIFGAFGGTPQVKQIGTGEIVYNSTAKEFVLYANISTSGPVTIQTATLLNPPGLTAKGLPITLNPGTTEITIYFTNSTPVSLQSGDTYTVSLGLSDGTTVQVAALYE